MAARRFTEPQRVEQRNEALRLWMSGLSYRSIAAKLDVSHQTAYDRVQQAIEEMRPHADFDHYRAKQIAEIDVSRRPLRAIIATWKPAVEIDGVIVLSDHKRLTDAITSLIRLQEREAKLLGLDRVTTPIDEITALSDDELEQAIADWVAESADA